MDRKKSESQLPIEAFCDSQSLSPKILSLRSRLRLKRTDSQSSIPEPADSGLSSQPPDSTSSASCSSNRSENVKSPNYPSNDGDDSLIDFKSPKREDEPRFSLENFKPPQKKILSIKSKPLAYKESKPSTRKEHKSVNRKESKFSTGKERKISSSEDHKHGKESKPSTSQESGSGGIEEHEPGTSKKYKPKLPVLTDRERKSSTRKKSSEQKTTPDCGQMTIESSFFKPKTEVKTLLVCPLCFKSCKDVTSRNAHMKNCAARHKISTRKLLDAVDLQERQAEERKALGLLTAPVLQPKKTVSRKMISDKDPHLQLALALSMSLHEKQQIEELEEAVVLAGDSREPMKEEILDDYKKSLQNFGFTTNKPITASTSTGSRKKRPMGPTVLQTRSQEARDRLLTERIAEVLMGDEAITQAMQKDTEDTSKPRESMILRSRLLQGYHCVEDKLWDKTRLTPSKRGFYVGSLSAMISPCKAKPEDETKQPAESNSPKSQEQVRNHSSDKSGGSKSSSPKELESAPTISDDKCKRDAAVVRHPTATSKIVVEKSESSDDSDSLDKSLIANWRSMVDSSCCSDLLVFLKNDKKIYAHKLVFWVRCYSAMHDIVPNKDNKLEPEYKICWPEVGYYSAMGFLQFIYCGVIDLTGEIFNDSIVLSEIRGLARKYRLKELFAYLRERLKEWELKRPELEAETSSSAIDDNDEASASGQSREQLVEDQHKKPDLSLRQNKSEDGKNLKTQMDVDAEKNQPKSKRNDCNVNLSNMRECTDKKTVNQGNESTSDARFSQSPNKTKARAVSNSAIQQSQVTSYNENTRSVKITVTMEIPSEVINESTEYNEAVGPDMSKRFSTEDITALIDATTIRRSIENVLTSTRINSERISNDGTRESQLNKSQRSEQHDGIKYLETENKQAPKENSLLKIDKFMEREGSISPDIFSYSSEDESITEEKKSVPSDEDSNRSTEQGSKNLEILLSLMNKDSQFERPDTQSMASFSGAQEAASVTSSDMQKEISLNEPQKVSNCFENITVRRRKAALEKDTWKRWDESKPQINANEAMAKQAKSNVSLAIEKIQRLNAKTASDSDSDLELDSDLRFPVNKRRNPFNVDRDDSSYQYHKNCNEASYSNIPDEIPQKKRNALSIFEKEIEKEAAKNPTAFNLTSFKPAEGVDKNKSGLSSASVALASFQNSILDQEENVTSDVIDLSQDSPKRTELVDDVFDLTQASSDEGCDKTETDDADMSMYTRYRRKHKKNSIDRYRTVLRNAMSRSSVDSNVGLPAPNFSGATENTERDNEMLIQQGISTPENIHKGTSSNYDQGRLIHDEERQTDTNDYDLTDLEFDMSSCSTILLSENTTSGFDAAKKLSRRVQGNEEPLTDSLKEAADVNDIQLSDTEFTILKRDENSKSITSEKRIEKPDLSNEETDIDCYIEAISPPKQQKKFSKSRSNVELTSNERSNVYSDETDVEDVKETLEHTVNFETARERNDISEEDTVEQCKPMNTQRLGNSSKTRHEDHEETCHFEPILIESSPELPLDDFGYISNAGYYDMEINPEGSVDSDDEVNSSSASKSNSKKKNPCNISKSTPKSSQSVACERRSNEANEKFEKSSGSSAKNNFAAKARSRLVHEISLSPQSSPMRKSSSPSENTSRSATNIEDTKRCSESSNSQCLEKGGRGGSSKYVRSTSQEPKLKSAVRSLKAKSASERIIRLSPRLELNLLDDSFNMVLPELNVTPKPGPVEVNRDRITPQEEVSSNNITPVADYSVMQTPQLQKELHKYGLKAQKRNRAKILLRHIYNELHPLVPATSGSLRPNVAASSSEDEEPPPKRMNKTKSPEKKGIGQRFEDDNGSNSNEAASQYSSMSDSSDGPVLAEDVEYDEPDTLSQFQSSTTVEEAFRTLLEKDRDLHNKILSYTPLRLEELHATLKAQGFKCKLKDLVAFLDEQCITFRTQAQAARNRTRKAKKSPSKVKATGTTAKTKKSKGRTVNKIVLTDDDDD